MSELQIVELIFLLISISKDRITKARRFSQETTKKLGSSKEVNRNSKKKL